MARGNAMSTIQARTKSVTDVRSLIFSESYGNKSFNINVPERVACMRALFENNEFNAADHSDLSVRNLVDRYGDIQELYRQICEQIWNPDRLNGQ